MPSVRRPNPITPQSRRHLARVLSGLLLIVLLFAGLPARAQKVEVWLGPVTPDYYRKVDPSFGADFARMFEPNAPWQRAAERTKVMKVSTMFAFRAPDDLLAHMIADLKRRNIALALEGLMLTIPRPDSCGRGVEGYTGPVTLLRAAERIRRLGGELRYIAMDEPLYFGHYFTGPNACRTPIDALARDVADRIRSLRAVFPNLQVGDIEPFGGPQFKDWNDLLMQWAEAYRRALGEPLPFLHLDVQWRRPHQKSMQDLAGRLRKAGIRIGIIYNGDVTDTAEQWTARAVDRFVEVESHAALIPDQAIFQIWGNPKPPLNLPETDPAAFTSLVNRYAAEQTSLTLSRAGGQIDIWLMASGQPVSGVPVTLYAVDHTANGIVQSQTLVGRVPTDAVEATIALRLNAECNCSAPANIAIGRLRYHDDAGGSEAVRWFRKPMEGDMERFDVPAGQRVALNTQRFPVIAGSRFTLEAPLAATSQSAEAGYIAVIFLGADGKEVRRARMDLRPGAREIGRVTTAGDGSVSFRPTAAMANPAAYGVRARFNGDGRYRPSWATAP